MVTASAVVTGMGAALPPAIDQHALWDGFFERHYGGSPLARAVWQRSGVVSRHGVVDPRVEDLSAWSTGARMRRFLSEALPLGKEALAAAFDDAGMAPADVGSLTVVSCTGYATPGLDVLLARDLGLPADAQRLHVGHMGCYAALPSLATAADAAVARGRTTALLCLELTTLHVQPATDDREQMVAHALFADAAAAVVVRPGAAAAAGGPGGRGGVPRSAGGRGGVPRSAGGRGGVPRSAGGSGGVPRSLEVVDLAARTEASSAALMAWDVTDLGFRMRLSPKVPRVLAQHVREVVAGLLARHGLAIADVAAWAVHPGGPAIVDVVADRLGLDDDAVGDSRDVLASHGNCSSATVLLILDRIRTRGLAAGAPVVALAFGPGLTLYATLLRATDY